MAPVSLVLLTDVDVLLTEFATPRLKAPPTVVPATTVLVPKIAPATPISVARLSVDHRPSGFESPRIGLVRLVFVTSCLPCGSITDSCAPDAGDGPGVCEDGIGGTGAAT